MSIMCCIQVAFIKRHSVSRLIIMYSRLVKSTHNVTKTISLLHKCFLMIKRYFPTTNNVRPKKS